ncbi:MAG: sulfide/dihydroorotate dehydrogenase-like FAD/NAD-binding protein [Candidatus Ratteibacteria bacterium]|nr:sulfide/dihydroorotate dehydrogenase-like FAD/NAD-binding protein [Candidatus Ratteibacteria bacterium]
MYKIVKKEKLAPDIQRFFIAAPEVARAAKAGQFVILRLFEGGERFPLTIVSREAKEGLIEIVSQRVGKSTAELALLKTGDLIKDISGPLGQPSEIKRYGRVLVIGGGVGIAPLLPITRALKEAGNEIMAILGVRSKEMFFFEDEFKTISRKIYFTTDDGSLGRKGLVTDVLKMLIDEEEIQRVLAIGPVVMMKAVSNLTKKVNIPTTVSLNPIMVDGTGMCGACRCLINGKSRFACIHGPEFDGHQVDFNTLLRRQNMFLKEEKTALEGFKKKDSQ